MRTLLVLLLLPTPAVAGLHYSGEAFRELPADWRGFLPDHRTLRAVGAPPAANLPSPPLRDAYTDAALRLEAAAKTAPLTADQAADLGALYVRLGQPQKAIDLLRPAARKHPDHFRLAANLGTAWQTLGDLDQAALALEEAVRNAPADQRPAEELHLKLVRLRLREGRARDPAAPDALFDPATPPADAVAQVQRLALWLPADGRLLWHLGELAHAAGDVRTAAAILDGCVTEFAMGSPELRARRTRYRAAADALEAKGHRPDRGIAFKSIRALARGIDPARLPAVRPDGVNPLPWAAVAETEIGPRGKPAFLKYVDQLDGRRVSVAGFVAPTAGAGDLTAFLLTENPVGCWFCESPGPTQVLSVELAAGQTAEVTRLAVKVTGTLRLNRADPERFPFVLTDATVGPAD